MACEADYPEKARYDNYRLIRVHLETQEHVDLFQELEEESDSYTFYGHALNVNQDVTIMVAAHKIFEIQDLTQRYGIKYTILVSEKRSNNTQQPYNKRILSLCLKNVLFQKVQSNVVKNKFNSIPKLIFQKIIASLPS